MAVCAWIVVLFFVQCCLPGATAGFTMSFEPPYQFGGHHTGRPYGGKMSNLLDLYPDGFADSQTNEPVQSTDGGKTYSRVLGLLNASEMWAGFATYTKDATGHRWAHDFGPGALHQTSNKSFASNFTSVFRFENGNLTRQYGAGQPVTFTGLPRAVCAGASGFFTPYAAGHINLPDGTHLQSGELVWCGAPFPRASTSLVTFHSKNGYDYEYVGNISTPLDLPRSSEGPNEHALAQLPNGDVLCVMRTGAGDGAGGYAPFYRALSTDGGRTWSKPVVMPDIGCARPEMVQVGNVTILTGGRKMMGHSGEYDRSFDVWMSEDHGVTWERTSGSYQHNLKAHISGAPLWPETVNRTGWRFEFTSGYIGLVRAGESSAVVMYDIMFPIAEGTQGGKLAASATSEQDFVKHNPPYSFAMRIDIVPKAQAASHVPKAKAASHVVQV